ncbi:MAG: YjjG family noncanonical pyrimidine nucleotidase [Cyclobacteriaceae bacterium]|nr:YjjG family noncanonical pyrimidine nucleotidase [Cyclobacteriaceae bacterium]
MQSKKYKHIFFDLDHTLWDYEKNSEEALAELHAYFDLFNTWNIDCRDFTRHFYEVNYSLWDQFNKRQIHQDQLRKQRFPLVLARFDLVNPQLADDMSVRYLNLCPAKPHLMPFSLELLQYLKPRYQLHVLTNGASDVQMVKMRSSGIDIFFDFVITSDQAESRKPEKEIFLYALHCTGARSDNSIMIGDNLDTDIAGASAITMDSIFYNPHKKTHNQKVAIEVQCLSHITAWL